jgi:hypothetical protein
MTKPLGTFHDAITGETIERELTDEEIKSIVTFFGALTDKSRK